MIIFLLIVIYILCGIIAMQHYTYDHFDFLRETHRKLKPPTDRFILLIMLMFITGVKNK